jgi:hypothetical protein
MMLVTWWKSEIVAERTNRALDGADGPLRTIPVVPALLVGCDSVVLGLEGNLLSGELDLGDDGLGRHCDGRCVVWFDVERIDSWIDGLTDGGQEGRAKFSFWMLLGKSEIAVTMELEPVLV